MNSQDLFLVLALAVLIFMMFWNSRKRKKQAEELQATLKKGAAVVLHSGIYGVIESVDGDRFVIATAGSKLEVAKGAVRGIDTAAKPVAKTSPAKTAQPVARAAAKPAAKKPATRSAAKPAAKKPAAK
jgi:preprotein translocase YajC subunit